MSAQTLPGLEQNHPKSAILDTIHAVRDELAQDRELTPAEALKIAAAEALAASIDAGNMKGRSVANDVERLLAILDSLHPETETATDELTPEQRRIIDTLASPPQIHPVETGHAA